MAKKVIGIIGGMGPMASLHLQKLIIQKTRATKDQDHIPVICFSNPQIPDRTESLKNDGGLAYTAEVIKTANALHRAGATIGVMACNTAHAKFFDIQSKTPLQLLNVIEITMSFIKSKFPNGARVGLLATDGTVQSKVFSTFSDENMHLVLPANQQRVMEAIYSTKAGNREKGLLLLKMLINELAEQQVDCVILGCTELSLYYDELRGQKSPLLIDPMDITADFIVNSYAS